MYVCMSVYMCINAYGCLIEPHFWQFKDALLNPIFWTLQKRYKHRGSEPGVGPQEVARNFGSLCEFLLFRRVGCFRVFFWCCSESTISIVIENDE